MADRFELDEYRRFLKEQARANSSKLLTNSGIDYASELMSVLLDNTSAEARIYCRGFRRQLVWSQPYKNSLINFIDSPGKSIKVLVESDCAIKEEPIQKLNEKFREGKNVELRLISDVDKANLENELNGHCHFAVFDDQKFRLEIDPENFRAFGSFNDFDVANRLKSIFDKAFVNAHSLLPLENSLN